MEHSDYFNYPVEAYSVMLHLVSHKTAQFTDIQVLSFWGQWKRSEAGRVMGHINHRSLKLSEETAIAKMFVSFI